MCILEGDTGVDFQTSPVPLPQKIISSRPNPTKKLGENPVPFHSRKNDSHSLPLPCCVFFWGFFWLKSVSYSKNIVGYRSQRAHLSWIKTQNVVFCYYIELKASLCTVYIAQIKFHVNHPC